MVFHGMRADPQDDCNFLIGFALRDPLCDFPFPGAEVQGAPHRRTIHDLLVHEQKKGSGVRVPGQSHRQLAQPADEGPSLALPETPGKKTAPDFPRHQVIEWSGKTVIGNRRASHIPANQLEGSPAAIAYSAILAEQNVPATETRLHGLEEIRLDEPARELYAADNYLGGRVMVFDLDTFKFKRGWGAYGHALSEISTNDADHAYTPGGPMPKEFRGHLTLNFSNDGLVYAADRMANRIHVTTKEGKFVKEFILAPTTGVGGSTGGVMFSADKLQRFLYISDLTNNHIWFLNREDGKVVGQMGSMGENGGQFFGLHMIATDSKGNRRLEDPHDFVRLEIAAALARHG
jgi:hypothetical protein